MQLVDSPKSWADWGSRHHCWNRWGKCYLLFLRFKIIQILFKTDIFFTWYFLHIAVPYVKAQVQCRSQGCPEVGFRRGLSAWARISPDCPRQECSYTDAHNQRAHCPRNNHPFVSLIQILICQILFKTEISKTSILSRDMWAAYNGIQQALPPNQVPYQHFTVNHSVNFVDPVTQACTNHVEVSWQESLWKLIEIWMKSYKLMSISVLLEERQDQVQENVWCTWWPAGLLLGWVHVAQPSSK